MNIKIDSSILHAKKTFLFDIGHVLLSFDFESSLIELVSPDIPNPHICVQRVLERKDILEKGEIDPVVYAQWALNILGSKATVEQFYHSWQQIFAPNLAMWDCVRKLAQKDHELMLISNINAIHCPWIFERYPEFSLFKQKILSFEIGLLKPDPAIYHYVIDTHQLDPKNTIYIDDQHSNIETGKSLGLLCWQYDIQQHDAFESWLEKLEA